MIELVVGALALVVNALRVELEGVVGSVDGDGDGADGGNNLLQSLLISDGNVDVTNIDGSNVLLAEMALLLISMVGVGLLGVDAVVLLDVLEGKVHQTSLASVVAVFHRAVDQVLLAERNQLSSFPEVLTFESSSGGEGPTGPAHPLVLDWRDGSLGPPVDCFRQADVLGHEEGGGREVVDSLVLQQTHFVAVSGAGDLVVELISEMVHLEEVALFSQVSLLVVSGDLVLVVHEDLHPEVFFDGRGVALVVELLPGLPLLVVGSRVDGRDEQEQQQDFHLQVLSWNC